MAQGAGGGGRPPKDDRLMLSAMLYGLRIGAPWRDLPACSLGARTTSTSAACWPPPEDHERLTAPFHRGDPRLRHKIGNFFCRIKRVRRISIRYDKLTETLLGFVQLAAITDWLSHRF